jgi:hypothetical protein
MTDNTSQSDPLSRRSLLKAGAYAAGVVATIGTITSSVEAQVAKKAAQSTAGYKASPNGSKSCSNCRHFQAPSSCNVVDGSISGDGYCNLYAKKA